MTRNISIALAVVALVLFGIWFYFKPAAVPPVSTNAPTNASTSPLGGALQAGDTAKSSVSSAVGKTNPFQTNVNPVSGYQNPFEK